MNLRNMMQLIGLGIIVYLSLQVATLQTVILLSSSNLDPQVQQDEISLYEARFSRIKDDLRSVNGVIGYLGCPDLDTTIMTYHYFLTQYVLAPISIDDNLDNVLVLGNLPPELCDISSINLKQNNLSIKREYGNGLFLLEHGD